eukprot:scaffold78088_cov50-Phaeocystis_antarctica.AAC.5
MPLTMDRLQRQRLTLTLTLTLSLTLTLTLTRLQRPCSGGQLGLGRRVDRGLHQLDVRRA